MQKIFSPLSTVERICSQQKYQSDVRYRRTTFCIEIPCDNGRLLFHTLTGVLFLLDADESLESCKEELVKHRFLVPEAFDEKQYLLEVRRVLSLLRPYNGKRTSFTILTTTDCNARCFYCYEFGCRRMSMDEKTAADTADYIARVSGGDKVKLSWFGGEPLYNAQAIDTICSCLRERGVKYKSSVASNGYLFDEPTAKKAEELWNLQSAQITLDGTAERYQKIKAYIYHDDHAFDRVLDNIDHLLSHHVSVTVRLNMNRENADDLLLLCDELEARFKGKENFSVYPVLLKGFIGEVGEFSTDEEAVDRYQMLRNKLLSAGLLRRYKPDRNIRFQRCMADNDSCEVIKPDGSIGKCEHFDESDVIGRIDTDERDEALISAWKEQVFEEKCRDCPILPRCIELKKCAWSQGGCSEAVRRIRILKLKDAVLDAYQAQLKDTLKAD